MFTRSFQFLKIYLLLLGAVIPLLGGNFVPPAEGPLPFRRDRVPLDAGGMLDLSMRISTIADGLTDGTAWELRSAAQLLALSLALDPVNTEAREILQQFTGGNHRAAMESLKIQESRDRIHELLGWLDTDSAGRDGQALAACLKDVVAISRVVDGSGELPKSSMDIGNWAKWIPEMSRYEDRPTVAENDVPPADDPENVGETSPLLAAATVTVPLWREIPNSTPPSWSMVLSELKMVAGESAGDESNRPRFSLTLGDEMKNPRLSAVKAITIKLLHKLNSKLPNTLKVDIQSKDFDVVWPKSRSQSLSAAVAVLASAAITGREPIGTILGEVDEEGNYRLPANYWLQLRSLPSSGARRVILPEAAASDLPSILAMGDPQFFMDHEVLLAKDFQQLLELSAAKPEAAIAAANVSFNTIYEKLGTLGLGPYLATTAVRRRLAELAQSAPFHFSARMLALQGAGDRPTYINRNVLISELLLALEPMDWLVKRGREPFTSEEIDRLGTTFESCRNEVERLLRYTDKSDKRPVEMVLEMLNLIRTLDRASRSRPDSSGNNFAQQIAYEAFIKSAKETLGLLGSGSAATEE